jgi:hypothetical protein
LIGDLQQKNKLSKLIVKRKLQQLASTDQLLRSRFFIANFFATQIIGGAKELVVLL